MKITGWELGLEHLPSRASALTPANSAYTVGHLKTAIVEPILKNLESSNNIECSSSIP